MVLKLSAALCCCTAAAAAAPAVGFVTASAGAVPCPSTNVAVSALVYGGTAGGVVAAVAAARMLPPGQVFLANPSSHHLGGMVSGGLGMTDGRDSGGIAREFFEAVGGYRFAPSTAERVFVGLARNASVRWAGACRIVSIVKTAGELTSVATSSGGVISARVFIDATCECRPRVCATACCAAANVL
jgi:hypothetical protein